MIIGAIEVVNKKSYKEADVIDISRYGSLGLGNPFRLKNGAQKGSTLPAFRKYLWRLYQQDLVVEDVSMKSKQWTELRRLAADVKSGESLKLGCYCAPNKCHGDVIKSAVEWLVSTGENDDE